jgi:hypothetical protein
MPRTTSKPLQAQAIDAALLLQEAELAELRSRLAQIVIRKTATGTGDIDHAFALDSRFRLVFVRCHFSGAAGTSAFRLELDSGTGSAYDARMFTITQAGPNKDVYLRIGEGDALEPSAWTFQVDDALRITWTNPDSGNITWGLEVGLAPAA